MAKEITAATTFGDFTFFIHTDDTEIKTQYAGDCRETNFWPYQGDWLKSYTVIDFTIDRKRTGPLNFLKDFAGYSQADA